MVYTESLKTYEKQEIIIRVRTYGKTGQMFILSSPYDYKQHLTLSKSQLIALKELIDGILDNGNSTT